MFGPRSVFSHMCSAAVSGQSPARSKQHDRKLCVCVCVCVCVKHSPFKTQHRTVPILFGLFSVTIVTVTK